MKKFDFNEVRTKRLESYPKTSETKDKIHI